MTLFITVCYLVAMLLIGYLTSKYLVKSSKDFWLGGRTFGTLIIWATTFSTFLSAASLLGYMGMYYSTGGYAAMWQNAGVAVGWLMIVPLFLHKIRRMGYTSMGDLYLDRYGGNSHIVATILILYTQLGYLMMQLIGMGAALSILLKIPMQAATIIGFLVVILYTTAGGLVAVAWTDVAQSLLILTCSFIAFPIALSHVGGFAALKDGLTKAAPYFFSVEGKGLFTVSYSIKNILMWSIGDLAWPIVFVRSMSARDEHVARYGFILAGLSIVLFFGSSMGLMGAVRLLLPNLNPKLGDAIWPTAISALFPPAVAGILVSAVLAAIMSTCDAILHLAGTVFSRDIYQRFVNKGASDKQLLSASRIGTFLSGIGCLVLALLFPKSIFKLVVYIFQFIANGLGIPIMAAFYWKRANETGAVASSVAGSLVTLFWGLAGRPFGLDEFFAGLIASVAGMIIGSLVTAPPDESIVSRYFGSHMSFRTAARG